MTSPATALARPPLRRVRECAVAGVASGLAVHLGVRPAMVRALFVVLGLLAGAGVLLYLWLWATVPWADPASGERVPSRRWPVAWLLIAASAAGVVAIWSTLIDSEGYVQLGSAPVIAAVLATTVLASAAGLWAGLVDRADPARGPRHGLVVRIAATGVLTVAFLLLATALGRGGLLAFVLALLPLLGIGVVFSSSLVRKWQELSGERVRRIREEQRSEMAAHLHDSVLQTLALIQNRAGASSEVARIARAQERELRAWLYDGDAPADSDLPTDLRDYAAALELDYPVRIEVVLAGLTAERASGEVAAAAREAMLNAARHAGGEVSVYIEGTPASVDVFIRDRGPGFVLADVPSDRLGVRESIIGRLRRAGGSATVRGTAGGTEVHLRFAPEARLVEQADRRG